MATYKVPQNVEAEDKLLGPLTFKQFIFLLIASAGVLFAWLFSQVHPALVILPLPIILIFGGLAVFRREDQPAERYLLSFFNFMLRPRQRVWNTEGYYEHLVINATKKPPQPELKQNLDQVHGQLERLARVVDTRGWAAKRPDLVSPGSDSVFSQSDDRLFMPNAEASSDEISQDEDILDEQNPEAQNLENLLHEQTLKRREHLLHDIRSKVSKAADQDEPPAKKPEHKAQEKTAPETTQSKEDHSDILELSDKLSVSQVQAVVNRKKDQNLQEGEEIKLR